MNIEQLNLEDTEDYREGLIIKINGKVSFCGADGEPKDNGLGRNFNDCYNIVDMMRTAWEAGVSGQSFISTNKSVGWDDFE